MVTLRRDLLAISREHGINLSKLLETSLIQLLEAKNNAQTPNRASFLGTASFTKEGVVLRPGFEPGSPTRKAGIRSPRLTCLTGLYYRSPILRNIADICSLVLSFPLIEA